MLSHCCSVYILLITSEPQHLSMIIGRLYFLFVTDVFSPWVTTSVLKSTLGSCLQKSSVLGPKLQGLCQFHGSLWMFAIALGAETSLLVAGEITPVPPTNLQRLHICAQVISLTSFARCQWDSGNPQTLLLQH